MKTIAQQLKVKEFPFYIRDSRGNEIYYENSKGKIVDSRPKDIVLKNTLSRLGTPVATRSNGFWVKMEYDSQGNMIYREDSDGKIIDNRPKEVVLTMDEIAQRLNIPVEQLKIKK